MYYKKVKIEDTVIEFHNNWLGVETVIVNGQIASKKASIWGTHHHFTLMEDGHMARYVLTTKVNASMQVFIDIRRNGKLIREDIEIRYGMKPKLPKNKLKYSGIAKLNEYDMAEAISDLKKALDVNPKDPEIYFYLACAYSIEEDALQGFESLKKAVAHKLQDIEMILNHDMLAYLRLQEPFEDFLDSNFTTYDPSKLPKKEEDRF